MLVNGMNNRRGFTLVEMLAVVAIIALLTALLVPAINSARTSARKTATSATLNTLTVGLESFRTQQELGTRYPPSAPDRNGYTIANPYQRIGDRINGASQPGPNNLPISGAGLLYTALMGADGLGTAGFRPTSGNNTWADSTSDTSGGLYEIPTTGNRAGEPAQRRYGPFVDSAAVPASQFNTDTNSFVVPMEESAAPGNTPQRNYPMFVDSFGSPILYWRADTAGRRIADFSPDDLTGADAANRRGIYHFRDNAPLLVQRANLNNDHAVLRIGERTSSPFNDLDMQSLSGSDGLQVNYFSDSDNINRSFGRHILDLKVTGKAMPQNADSFLLLSPGPDLIYGTRDDIGNFTPNGGLR